MSGGVDSKNGVLCYGAAPVSTVRVVTEQRQHVLKLYYILADDSLNHYATVPHKMTIHHRRMLSSNLTPMASLQSILSFFPLFPILSTSSFLSFSIKIPHFFPLQFFTIREPLTPSSISKLYVYFTATSLGYWLCMRNPVDSHNTIMSLYNSIMMRS